MVTSVRALLPGLAVLAALLAGCMGPGSGREVGPLVGNVAPDFTLEPVNAPRFTLSEQRGKVVLLDLMGVNCPPCRAEMPELRKAAQAHADDEGFFMVAVDMATVYPGLGARNEQEIRDFVEEFRATWPFAADTDGVGRKYQPISLPVKVYIGPDGVIREVKSGGTSTAAQIEASIARAREA